MGSLSTLGTSIERSRPGVRTGVAEITVHAARKTCASLLVALDVHPRVAMQILRHSQIAVTMNVYSEVSSQDTRDALRRLGEQLSGTSGGASCDDGVSHRRKLPTSIATVVVGRPG